MRTGNQYLFTIFGAFGLGLYAIAAVSLLRYVMTHPSPGGYNVLLLIPLGLPWSLHPSGTILGLYANCAVAYWLCGYVGSRVFAAGTRKRTR